MFWHIGCHTMNGLDSGVIHHPLQLSTLAELGGANASGKAGREIPLEHWRERLVMGGTAEHLPLGWTMVEPQRDMAWDGPYGLGQFPGGSSQLPLKSSSGVGFCTVENAVLKFGMMSTMAQSPQTRRWPFLSINVVLRKCWYQHRLQSFWCENVWTCEQ